MTEQEWMACTDLTPMLEFLRGKTSDRKLRLFAVACCHGIWDWIKDDRSKKALDVAQGFADGTVSNEDRERHFRAASDAEADARRVMETARDDPNWTLNLHASLGRSHLAASASAQAVADNPAGASELALELSALTSPLLRHSVFESVYAVEKNKWVVIVRDIIGNPFHPASVDPPWLTATVVALAQAIYADRAFDRLPILADALEEAGCTDADILAHCRGPGPHVRGCWVVDLLLGKE
jgi:hypothetical protein